MCTPWQYSLLPGVCVLFVGGEWWFLNPFFDLEAVTASETWLLTGGGGESTDIRWTLRHSRTLLP